jgi:bifunctional non-homologous end joining protein LigD
MALEEYRKKRSADRTPEPFGKSPGGSARDRGMFVIQKHAARRLHYDFRLEMEGVLRSWAVPKGPSLDPRERRLAVMVEDHPIEYANFEGVIPPGNYGAGEVIVWDRGEYRTIDPPGDAAEQIRKGKADLELRGFKLNGAFTLVRTRYGGGQPRNGESRQQWLLIKKRDEQASDRSVIDEHPRSVLSGLTIEDMREAGRIGEEARQQLKAMRAPQLKGALSKSAFPLQLAKLGGDPFDGEEWLFEIKYDGVRALALREGAEVRLYGRNQTEITERYPEVALALRSLPFDRFALDGEIVVHGPDGRPNFQLLQHRIQARTPAAVARMSFALPVHYYVFDVLAFGEFDLRPLELERRKQVLSRLIKGEGAVRYCDHVNAHGREFFAAAAAAGLEGIVAKRRHSPYRGIRGGDWVKLKCPRLERFVIGGWTDPGGSRRYFGALLLGQYEPDGQLRFVGRVGTGFDEDLLKSLAHRMNQIRRPTSPFRRPAKGEATVPRDAHFCEPDLVAEVQFSEWTDDGVIRQPSFKRLVEDGNGQECRYQSSLQPAVPAPEASGDNLSNSASAAEIRAAGLEPDDEQVASEEGRHAEGHNGTSDGRVVAKSDKNGNARDAVPPIRHRFKLTNLDKVFWPADGYTKGDLVAYYEAIAPWMLPYLKDRPVVLTRYPNGIEGKSFFQKDAPAFAPDWIRKEKIYAEDAQREIAYFIVESAETLAYIANSASIPIHMWSSRIQHLERPDWLLFDIDPKGATTREAVTVARAVITALEEVGMRPYVKTSGQKGIHVMVGLVPEYTYVQARMFSEMVARVVEARMPEVATLVRDVAARKGRAYIDYLQLGHGKTIVAPFAVRPVNGAPVSAPLKYSELRPALDPSRFNIKTIMPRMERLKTDPFMGVLTDLQRLEPALPRLEKLLRG